MFINEAPSTSVIKAVKNYWEIIFAVFAGATIMAASLGFGLLASFSCGIAIGSTLGVWVALKKYEENFLSGTDSQVEDKADERK
jgi:hypothetical protein